MSTPLGYPRVLDRRAVLTTGLAFVLLSGGVDLSAQVDDPVADSTRAGEADNGGGTTFVPLPVLFYQPETGFGFGAMAIWLFQSSADSASGDRRQPSMVAPVAIYTAKNQIILSVRTELYSRRYRALGEGSVVKFPTKYWGIGNDTFDAEEEDFTPLTFNLQGDLQREISPGWHAGGAARFAYRELLEVDERGEIGSGEAPGSEDGWAIGVGLLFTRDTRNNTVFPTSGVYHQLRGMLFGGVLGSDYEFGAITLDVRSYLPGARDHVLALRALVAAYPGSPPFDIMPMLGGESLLRGYFQGRYRDRNLLAFQAEYRAPIWWRFGIVGFASAGQVAHKLADVRLTSRFHPAVGLGLRFKLAEEEGLNLRADYGWGFDVKSGGFYLSFSEAY